MPTMAKESYGDAFPSTSIPNISMRKMESWWENFRALFVKNWDHIYFHLFEMGTECTVTETWLGSLQKKKVWKSTSM